MSKAGPKGVISATPLDFSHLPTDRGERAIAFIQEYLVVPKGEGALEPVVLREWQRDVVRGVFAPGVRQGLVSIPRGNGKSGLAAFLALYALFADGEEGAQILCVASDERQARIVFDNARRMVELNPELMERTHIYKDRIYVPHTNSTLSPLPAEPAALQGWDPSLVIVDELHVVTEDVYEAMTLASGKRGHSLLLSISTPAGDKEGVMWRLVLHGRIGDDPSFYFREWAAPEGCDLADENAWAVANPALDDFLQRDALRANLRTTRSSSFRRYRLGQWSGQAGSWLPEGAWDACETARTVAPRERVTLGFDGSYSGDSTALVGCTQDGHVFLVGLWLAPEGDRDWRVPRAKVTEAVENAMKVYRVDALVADPYGWESELQEWDDKYGVIERVPTYSAARMAPLCDVTLTATLEGHITHDGDSTLASHVMHCVAKETSFGEVVTKDRKGSPRKIDAAVAMILAFSKVAMTKKRKRRAISF